MLRSLKKIYALSHSLSQASELNTRQVDVNVSWAAGQLKSLKNTWRISHDSRNISINSNQAGDCDWLEYTSDRAEGAVEVCPESDSNNGRFPQKNDRRWCHYGHFQQCFIYWIQWESFRCGIEEHILAGCDQMCWRHLYPMASTNVLCCCVVSLYYSSELLMCCVVVLLCCCVVV